MTNNINVGSDTDYPNTAQPFYSGLGAGNYQVQIQNNPGGCFVNSTPITIATQQVINSLTVTATPTDPLCNNGNGSISASATGQTGAVSFSLNDAAYNASNPNPITGVVPNAYTVYAIDVNGCKGSKTTTIGNPQAVNVPTASVTSGTLPNHNGRDITCVGANNGQITISASGGTGSFQYSINNGTNYFANGGVFSPLPPGTYTIKVKDSNGCEKIAAAPLTVSDPPSLIAGTAAGTNPLCNLSTGSITVSSSAGGTGTLQYSRDGVSAFQTGNVIANVPAATYNNITIKDANGCTAIVPSTVTLTAPPAIGVGSTITQPTCFGSTNGKITVTATNGVGILQYSKDGGTNFQSSNIFNSNIGAGSYSIAVKDANGCLSPPSTAVVGQPSALTGGIVIPPAFSCFNTNNTAALNLTPSGGTAPYTFLWSNSAITEDISIIMGSSLSTTYSVGITDSKGCTTNRTITVTQPSQLTTTIASTNITCFGANNGSINLTPTGGTGPYSFLWSNGTLTEDLSGRAPGTYSVTITDANSCTASNSATLTEPAVFTLTQGTITPVLCHGQPNGTVDLNAGGGTSPYEYSANGTVWQTTSLITGLSASASPQILYARDQNGCAKQINVIMTEPNVLSVSTSNIISATCGQSNGSAASSASGGTSPYSFVWKNYSSITVSTTSALTNVPGGVYRVTLTDKNGCSDYKDVPISSPNGPQVIINSVTGTQCWNSNDGRANITVTSGQIPYKEIKWNNGETGLLPNSLRPGSGINIVTVTDANDCVGAFSVDVPSPPILQVNATPTQATCPAGSDGSVLASALGGTGAYSYAWSTGATVNPLSNVSAGSYQVTAKDANNCSVTLQVQLTDKPAIVIDATSTTSTCAGKTDGSINVTASGGNGAFSYAWNTGATGSSINNIGAGSYTVTVTDGQLCQSQKQIVLLDPPPLQLDLGPDRKICVGGVVKISSPIQAPSYAWTSPNGFTSDQKEVTLKEAGVYTLRVTNAQGCIAEDSFTLSTATDLLKADFLMIPEAYEGDTVIVIDISWPLPEGITWHLPSESRIVTQNSDYVEMIFDKSGDYTVEMDAAIASCQDSHSQTISIIAGPRPATNGRIAQEGLIKEVRLHPNPNAGDFAVDVELARESPVEMTIISMEGNTMLVFQGESGKQSYHWAMHVPQLSQGIYFLLVRAGKESRMVRMVKI